MDKAPSAGMQMKDGLQQSAKSVLCGAAVVVLAAPPQEGRTGAACGGKQSAAYLHQAPAQPDSAAVHSSELRAGPACLTSVLRMCMTQLSYPLPESGYSINAVWAWGSMATPTCAMQVAAWCSQLLHSWVLMLTLMSGGPSGSMCMSVHMQEDSSSACR